MLTVVIPGCPIAKKRHRTAPLQRCLKCSKTQMGSHSNCKYCGSQMQFVSNVPYSDAVSAKYENLVAYCASMAMKEQGIELIKGRLVGVECKFYMPIPESRACKKGCQYRGGETAAPPPPIPPPPMARICKKLHEGEPHGQRPDLDNLLKSLDGLNGVVWSDDAVIHAIEAQKLWSNNPRTEIKVF